MKKVSSVVWQFFDRVEDNKKCVAVLCKLCDTEYKYFGNTTNLRAHLIKKHPIQWEFRQNNIDPHEKPVSETVVIRQYVEDDSTNQSASSPKRRKYGTRSTIDQGNNGYETSVVDADVADEDDEATLNLVRQMHDSQGSDEEWLEEDYVRIYEPAEKKLSRKIKREVVSPPRTTSYIPHSSSKHHTEKIIIDDFKKDEYSVFGEYIANKLRKFKSSRTKGNIQQIITTILWQAEYGMYDDAESVKRLLMSSIHNPEPERHNVSQDQPTVISPVENNYDEAVKAVEESNQFNDSAPL